jgi:hypothetical protein
VISEDLKGQIVNDSLAGPAIIAAIILVFWSCYILPAGMARTRGRSVILWIFLSLLFSPLISVPLLLAMGNAQKSSG